MRLPFTILTASAIIFIASAPTLGQNESICVAKQTVGKPGGDHIFTLVVPKTLAATLKNRGFTKAPCRGRDKTTRKLRNQMCKLAAQNMPEAERSFEQVYSVRPSEICQLSKQVLGEQ